MPHVYAVELLAIADAGGGQALTKYVSADDRYEAVALARQLVTLQNPEVVAVRIETAAVTRQPAARA